MRSLIKDTHCAEDKIYIYGIGNYAVKLCEYYGKDVIENEVEAFVVSDKEEKRDFFYGIRVVNLNEVEHIEEHTVIIAMAKDTRYSILNNISKLFKKMILLEEFMNMAYFIQNSDVDRNYEIEEYYDYFKKRHPLPQYIEIETINRCNGECGFCPVNKNEIQRPYAKMPEELFFKIIDELKELKFKGKVALFSNNEPFLDKRITKFARYASERLEDAYIYLATNGTIVTCDKFKEIISYLDEIIFDIYVNDSTDINPHNIQEILRLAEKSGDIHKIKVSRINKKAIRSSRGGKSPNSKVDFVIKDKCPLPMVQMVIRPDGKVSLCCNDALGAVTLGDISKESVLDVWNSDQYNQFRKLLLQSRENLDLCKYCDYIDMRRIERVENE